MSKYVKGSHVRVTDPAHHDFDQVGEVADVIRELNQWLYSVRFGIAYVPVPERYLILAVAPSEGRPELSEADGGRKYRPAPARQLGSRTAASSTS